MENDYEKGYKDEYDNDDSMFRDSDYEMDDDDEDDELFEKSVDPNIKRDGGGMGFDYKNKDKGLMLTLGDSSKLKDIVNDDFGTEEIERVRVDPSDDLYSLDGSDNEDADNCIKKWPEFNAITDMDDPIFCVKMLFRDKKVVKRCFEEC